MTCHLPTNLQSVGQAAHASRARATPRDRLLRCGWHAHALGVHRHVPVRMGLARVPSTGFGPPPPHRTARSDPWRSSPRRSLAATWLVCMGDAHQDVSVLSTFAGTGALTRIACCDVAVGSDAPVSPVLAGPRQTGANVHLPRSPVHPSDLETCPFLSRRPPVAWASCASPRSDSGWRR